MRFEGTFEVAAPKDRVWAFITDPKEVTACAPDVRSVEVDDPTHFRVTVRAGLGPIRATFKMNVEFSELRPEDHLTVLANGQAPGSAVEMRTTIDLEGDHPTTLRWAADVTVEGMIANVGERFMPSVADRMTKQIFECVRSKLEAPFAT
ncbi:MAG TPA: carbon monoxide dehydrogenase subunit G [Candidatus Polarisedimenticolia bacterium]|nr:carbon monoxide dehydrogenase subunit G [Candidatus Polarisedimenticolia bacterium]